MQLSLDDFEQHMIASGKSEHTATLYAQRVARFLKHLTEQRIEKITEDSAQSYIAGIKDKRTKRGKVIAVHQFLALQESLLTTISITRSRVLHRYSRFQSPESPYTRK
jgi:site-specific recombinase XerD